MWVWLWPWLSGWWFQTLFILYPFYLGDSMIQVDDCAHDLFKWVVKLSPPTSSKVVSTHLWNTPIKTFTNRQKKGISFIAGERGYCRLGIHLYGCVVIFLELVDGTVDGRNPAPPRMIIIPLFYRVFIHPRWCRISSINSMTGFLDVCFVCFDHPGSKPYRCMTEKTPGGGQWSREEFCWRGKQNPKISKDKKKGPCGCFVWKGR